MIPELVLHGLQQLNQRMTLPCAAAPTKALLEVWITLPAGLDDSQRALLQRAGESCPVKLSLEGSVPMRLHWG